MNKKIKILSTIIFISIFVTILSIVTNKNININLKSKEKLEFNYDNSELQNLTFDKYWEDYNIEQFRPTSSTFNLYDKKDYYNNENKTIIQTVTLTSDNADPRDPNHWIGQFTNLPKKYADGTEVNYVVREVTDENSPYYIAYDSKDGISITFNENTNVAREYALELYMLRNNKYYSYIINGYSKAIGLYVPGRTLYLDVNDNTNFLQVNDIYKLERINRSQYGMIINKSGNDYPESVHPFLEGDNFVWKYNYTPAKHTNNFYLLLMGDSWGNTYGFSLDDISTIGNETIVTSITNLKDLEVTKIWEDQEYENYRPETVTFDIYDSSNLNNVVQTITLDNSNQIDNYTWKKTVKDLKKYDENGQEIQYTIKERNVENYKTVYDYSEKYNGLSITFSNDTTIHEGRFKICYQNTGENETNYGEHYIYNYKCIHYLPEKVAGRTINIPSLDLYIVDDSELNERIKIENITPIVFDNPNKSTSTASASPSHEFIEADIDEYLNRTTTGHKPFVWHYEWKGTYQSKPNVDTVKNKINLTDIEVTKIWEDTELENYRPNEVSFDIYDSNNLNEIVQTITLDNSNQIDNYTWKKIVKNLKKYDDNGKEIKYTIKEKTVENYKTIYDYSENYNALLIRFTDNTTESSKIKICYEKIEENQYKCLNLNGNYAGRNIIVPRNNFYLINLENNNSQTEIHITDIQPITYEKVFSSTIETITQDLEIIEANTDEYLHQSGQEYKGYQNYIWHYEWKGTYKNKPNINIVKNEIEGKTIKVEKKWDDIGQEEYRPNKVIFDIYNEKDLNTIVKTVELTNSNKIDNYTWQMQVKLPKTDNNNQEVQYIFKERPIVNYETTYPLQEIKGLNIKFKKIETLSNYILVCYDKDSRYLCNPIYQQENTEVQVPSIKFDVVLFPGYAKNVIIENVTPLYETPNEYTMQNQKYSDYINEYATGEEYLNYSIEEKPINVPLTWHYTLYENQSIVVNKALFKTIEVEKKWIDENYEVLRPNKIKLNVLKNNEIIKEVNLEKENDYKTTITLPKYENGQEIEYDIKEESIENYNTTYEKINNKVIITNEIILKDVVISKIDEEKNNLKGAILSIITETGNEVLEFTTEEKDTTIKLPKGQYILHEKKAPKGYLNANNITFNLDEKLTVNNEEVEKIIMIDKKQTNPITKDNINNYVKKLIFIISILLFTTIIKKNEEKN